ncbi:inner membrane protein YbjM [Salmonella enterica]
MVCLSLVCNMRGVNHAPARPEFGLLLFTLPGIISALFLHRLLVILPLVGAVLAVPFCYLLIHHNITPVRPFWQEMAWLFSAVFWCEIGALGCFFIRNIFKTARRSRGEPLGK